MGRNKPPLEPKRSKEKPKICPLVNGKCIGEKCIAYDTITRPVKDNPNARFWYKVIPKKYDYCTLLRKVIE